MTNPSAPSSELSVPMPALWVVPMTVSVGGLLPAHCNPDQITLRNRGILGLYLHIHICTPGRRADGWGGLRFLCHVFQPLLIELVMSNLLDCTGGSPFCFHESAAVVSACLSVLSACSPSAIIYQYLAQPLTTTSL